MNGRVALPLVLSAVILTAGGELERMAVRRPVAEVAPKLPAAPMPADETIVWKTVPQPDQSTPPPASTPSPLLARAQEKTPEKMPKVTSKADKCKLRPRSRACRKRAERAGAM